MRDLIQKIIQQELDEYKTQFTQQEKEITELQRRLKNMNRVGSVVEINENATRIKVKFGENVTPFIKWFSACAGDVAEYRCPSVGEQAVLINVGGGDNSSTSLALIGVPSDKFPLPTNNPSEILRVYPDGTKVSYNKSTHKLNVIIAADATVDISKSANIKVGGNTTIQSVGEAKVDAPKIVLNGKQGEFDVVTTNHPCQVTGLNHMCGSSTVKAGA